MSNDLVVYRISKDPIIPAKSIDSEGNRQHHGQPTVNRTGYSAAEATNSWGRKNVAIR